MTITAGRAQQVAFTVPYYREGVGMLIMADNSKYKTFDDLLKAGDSRTVGVMQNVFIEDWTRKGLPDFKTAQFEGPDATLQALHAGRVAAYLGAQSAIRWLMSQFPDRYVDSGYGWMPNSYASAVRQGDPIWLNWVNTVYREALMGVDFDYMKASYKKWFGIDVPIPKVGFPGEFSCGQHRPARSAGAAGRSPPHRRPRRRSIMSYNFNFAVIWRQFDVILESSGLGLLLAANSLVIGTVIG